MVLILDLEVEVEVGPRYFGEVVGALEALLGWQRTVNSGLVAVLLE